MRESVDINPFRLADKLSFRFLKLFRSNHGGGNGGDAAATPDR
jgi:hypothetical protein